VKWNPSDDEQPDYRHLGSGHRGARFDLIADDLEALIAFNDFMPPSAVWFLHCVAPRSRVHPHKKTLPACPCRTSVRITAGCRKPNSAGPMESTRLRWTPISG